MALSMDSILKLPTSKKVIILVAVLCIIAGLYLYLFFMPQREELNFANERKVLQRPSNICFGWEERKTAFIGSLDGTTIPFFQVPHPGARLIHQK